MENTLSEFISSFRNGNNWNDTDGVIGNSYQVGVNVRPFGDDLVPRYPIKHIPIEVEEGLFKKRYSLQEIFRTGNPQELRAIKKGGVEYLLLIVNGVWYYVDPRTQTACEIKHDNSDQKIGDSLQHVNTAVVERAIVAFDGDLPMFYTDQGLRRASYDYEHTFLDAEENEVTLAVPEGIRSHIGYYDNLRLWLGLGTNVLAASDAKGVTNRAPLSFFNSFTNEGEYTGQFPTIGTSYECITAIGTLIAQNPNFTGLLFVSTEDGIYLINSTAPRNQWEQTQGFIRQIVSNTAIANQKSWVNVGYDMLYSDFCGKLNSLSINQENLSRWATTNISTEVDNFIKEYDKDLYRFSSLETYADMVLQTAYPYTTPRTSLEGEKIGSVAFHGLLALSTQNLSGLNQQAQPVWAGLWTGVCPMFMAEMGGKLYILGDVDGTNQLFEMTDEIGNDEYNGKTRLIRSRVEFRNRRFQDSLFTEKEMKFVDVNITDIETDLSLLLETKCDVETNWRYYGDKCFEKTNCLPDSKCDIINNNNGYLKDYRIAPSSDACGVGRFKSLDFRITLEGLWRLKHIRLAAIPYPDSESLEFNDDDISKQTCCDDVTDYNLYRLNKGRVEIEYEQYRTKNSRFNCN